MCAVKIARGKSTQSWKNGQQWQRQRHAEQPKERERVWESKKEYKSKRENVVEGNVSCFIFLLLCYLSSWSFVLNRVISLLLLLLLLLLCVVSTCSLSAFKLLFLSSSSSLSTSILGFFLVVSRKFAVPQLLFVLIWEIRNQASVWLTISVYMYVCMCMSVRLLVNNLLTLLNVQKLVLAGVVCWKTHVNYANFNEFPL